MDEVLRLIEKVTGINNRLDDVRLPYNRENGVSALENGVNISIDNSGRPVTRLGTNLLTAGDYHSLWGNGSIGFCIYETPSYASLMSVASNGETSGLRSGLTKYKRMSYADAAGDIYYQNGYEIGKVVNGVSGTWAKSTYNGMDTKRVFGEIPIGSHVEFHLGRICIAVGNTILFSEPFEYGLFNWKIFWAVPTRITMLRSVEGGLFVSDLTSTYFLAGSFPGDFKEKTVLPYPAHEWSDTQGLVELDDMGFDVSGLGILWSSPKGVCVGFPSGEVKNITKESIIIPSKYTKGASLVCGHHLINTIDV